MNKEEQLEEILAKTYGMSVGLIKNIGLSTEYTKMALKTAYNLAIQDAADNAEADTFEDEDPVTGIFLNARVLPESILDLKITE